MDVKMIVLFTALTFVNVILQTVKSLCTIKCGTKVSALVNAVAYGLYCYVIFYTTADGFPLLLKAAITAFSNFVGVYVANFFFKKLFTKAVRWKIEVSIEEHDKADFERNLKAHNIEYYLCGGYKNWQAYAVFSDNKDMSKMLKTIMPKTAKWNIVPCEKVL